MDIPHESNIKLETLLNNRQNTTMSYSFLSQDSLATPK